MKDNYLVIKRDIIKIQIISCLFGIITILQPAYCSNDDGCKLRNSLLKCEQCEDGFMLDTLSNLCIFQNCQKGLFLQLKYDDLGNQDKKCVAICDNDYYHNEEQNICTKFDQCSLDFRIRSNLNLGDPIANVLSYQNDYVIILHQMYLLQVSRADGKFEQSLQIDESFIQLILFNEKLIVMSQTEQSIIQWDLSTNKHFPICQYTQLKEKFDRIQMVNIDNLIICSVSLYNEINTLLIEPLFQFSNLQPLSNLESINIVFEAMESILWFGNVIIRLKESRIRIIEIKTNNINYQITLQEFINSQYICEQQSNGFNQFQKLKNSDAFIAIGQNTNRLYIFRPNNCQINVYQDILLKFELLYNSDQEYIILLCYSVLIALNSNYQIIDSINLSPYKLIDFVKSDNNILYVLINDLPNNEYKVKELIISFQNSPKILKENQTYDVGINEPKQLMYLPKINEGIYYSRLFVFGNDFQSILIDQIDEYNQEKSEYIVENFKLGQPAINSQIKNIALLENQKLLLACTDSGYVYLWESSLIYDTKLMCMIKLSDFPCVSINYFENEDEQRVLVLFQNLIVIFDTFNCSVIQQQEIQNVQQYSQISIYENKAVSLFDNKLFLIFQNFDTIQQLNFEGQGEIKNISYQTNENLVLQLNLNSLGVYRINENTMQVIKIKEIDFLDDQIGLFRVKRFIIEYQQKIQNLYEIIIYLKSNKIQFMYNDLVVFSQINDLPIVDIIDLTFNKNDPEENGYFIGGKSIKKSSAYPYEIYIIWKNTQKYSLGLQISLLHKLFEPVKYYDPNSKSDIYRINMYQNLGFLAAFGTFDFEVSNQVNVFRNIQLGYDILSGICTLTQDKKYSIIGDSQGTIATKLYTQQEYLSIFQLNSTQIQNNEFITDIQQSYVLNKYFIVKNSIEIFNIHTNIKEQEITFDKYPSDPVVKLIVLEEEKMIVVCKQFALIVKELNSDKIYQYESQKKIQNILLYRDIQNYELMIFAYGQQIKFFEITLKLKKIIPTEQSITLCFSVLDTIICKQSNQQIAIITTSQMQIINLFKPKYNGDYNIAIDEQNQRIITYSFDVNIYNFKGNFKQKILTSQRQVTDIRFYGKSIVIISKTSLTFVNRETLEVKGELLPAGSGNIIKLIYIESYNHIALGTDIIRFASVFIYSLDSLNLVQSLKLVYTQNEGTKITDILFDKYLNQFLILDSTGNFIIYDYSGTYALVGFQLIREFHYNPNYLPLGMSLNKELNNLIIFSKIQLFQTNYAELSDRYTLHDLKQNNYFVTLPANNDSSNIELLILGENNKIFLYSQFSFSYFSRIINSEGRIKDIQLLSNSNIFIIAFPNSFQIFDASITSKKLSENIKNQQVLYLIKGYKFQQFLSQNIFLTENKQIIHYDFSEKKEVKIIQLLDQQWITKYKFILSINSLIIGLNDGTIILYHLQSQDFKSIDLKIISKNNSIRFIVETESYVWISTIQTRFISINKQNTNQIKYYNLNQFNGQNKTLQVFFVDQRIQIGQTLALNRLFISYLGEKMIRIIDLESFDITKIIFLSFPNSSLNKIYLCEKQIIFYSTNQLNIHERDDLSFIMSIRRQNLFDQIVQLHIFLGTHFLIVFQNKFEFIKVDYSLKSISLLDQIKVKLLRIVKAIYNEENKYLRVIGVSQDSLIDEKYSLGHYDRQLNLGYKQCSLNIKTTNSLQMYQTLNLIKPLYQQQPTMIGIVPIQDLNLNNYYTLYLQSKDLKLINFEITKEGQLTIVPFKNENVSYEQLDQSLEIVENTFQDFIKKEILIKDFYFIFILDQISTEINFHESTKKIYFQEIKIQNQILSDVSFKIQNMDLIVFMDITIIDLSLSYQNSKGSFFQFENCNLIQIINLKLQNVTFSGQQNYFIKAFNVPSLSIHNLTISNSKVDFFSLLSRIDYLSIRNVSILNCTNTEYQLPTLQIFVFKAFKVLAFEISDFVFEDNINLQFLNTQKTLKSEDSTITLNSDNLQIKKGQVFNNKKVDLSNVLQENHIFYIHASKVQITKVEYQQNFGNIYIIDADIVVVQSSQFIENRNLNGGGIQMDSIHQIFKIENCIFKDNRVSGSGGAIYINNYLGDINIDSLTKINGNSALIGGGIRFFLNPSIIIENQFDYLFDNKNIFGNSAQIYGQDIAIKLKKIKLKQIIYDPNEQKIPTDYTYYSENQLSESEKQLYSGKFILTNVRSGSLFKLSLQILDYKNDILQFKIQHIKNKIYPLDILDELDNIYFKLEPLNKSDQLVFNGETYITQDQFDENNLVFDFREFQITAYPQSQAEFKLEYGITYQESKPILILVNFRQCIEGEVLKYFSPTIISCYQCPEGQYSLILPQQNNLQESQLNEDDNYQCKKCPDTAQFCKGKSIILKDGYWRSGQNSSEIIYCQNKPNNCISEQNPDHYQIDGCTEGTIGPLCEECDYFGEKWKGRQYSRAFTKRYECNQCSEFSYQISFIILMITLFIFYLMASTFMFMSSFMHTQTCYYLRRLGLFPISANSIKDWSSFYLKILLNYLQISSSMIYFNANIFPPFFDDSINLIQSPTQKINVTIDCTIINIVKTRIEKTQALQIMQFLIPIMFYLILKCIFSLFIVLKKYRVKYWHQYTLLNVLFAFFQPSQISFFSQSLSCRQIGSLKLSKFDLLISCNDVEYNRFSQPFSIVIILLWILIPLWVLKNLKKKSHILDYCNVRYKYGFYYSEFKQKYYFWEFVRSNLRIALVLIFNLLQQNIYLVYLEIISIISVYIKCLLTYRPIYSNKLLQFEILSNWVIIINLILTAIYNYYNYQLIETLTYSIHLAFIGYIIIVILSYKISSKLNVIGRVIRWLLQKILPHRIYLRFETKHQIKFSSYKKWIYIRDILPYLIGVNALEKAKEASFSINNTCLPLKSKKIKQNQIILFLLFINTLAYFQTFYINKKESYIQKQMNLLAADVSKSFQPSLFQRNQSQEENLNQNRAPNNLKIEFVTQDRTEMDIASHQKFQKEEISDSQQKRDQLSVSISQSKIGFLSNSEKITDQSSLDISPLPLQGDRKKQKKLLPHQYQIDFINKTSLDKMGRVPLKNQ